MVISIIIPVYRIESYLCQCVNSVIKQSYRNLEIILVVDGSPDTCSQLCDKYAEIDNRIIVSHKINGGLSDARNYGVAIATGEYVLFVDGDDWLVDSEDITFLVERAKLSSADVINFCYKKQFENKNQEVLCLIQNTSMPQTIKNKEEQLQYISERGLLVSSVWNKLIRLSCIQENKLVFVVGETSEDVVWSLKLLISCHSLDFLNRSVYCYRQRDDSISHKLSLTSCKHLAKHIVQCVELAQSTKTNTDAYWTYTAYQFATFMKVQTFAEAFPRESIAILQNYSWVLRYHAGNRKIRILWRLTSAFGYANTCRLLYHLSWKKHRKRKKQTIAFMLI